jgi:exonuclease III
MILLCWNCQGLGRDSAVGELRWLVKQYRPSLLFLSETKMRDDSVRKFMWSLGFSGCFAINSEGRSGGLVLFWTDSSKISLKGYCKNFIDVSITQEDGLTWRATFVYGEPKLELRHVF